MARIPEDELRRLKREVLIEDLAGSRGIELKRSGASLVGLCPFHEETTGSLRIDPKRNLFHCFGCGAKGTVIDFVMLLEGVSFLHAVELLLAGYPNVSAPVEKGAPMLPLLVNAEASDGELRTDVAMYYHEVAKRSPAPIEYLELRGIDPAAVMDRFKLGFSNRSLGYRIPPRAQKVGKAIRDRLQELGIMKTTGHELMRGSLTVPIFDGNGQVVQMYGRKLNDRQLNGAPKHLYLTGPRRGVWNLEALAESKEIILCEALIDALTFVSSGFSNVTSAYGKNGFTEEHLEALKAYGTQRVLIAYDRDKASEPAAEALAQRLGAEGISCFRVQLPHGLDVNEYALKVTPPAQSLAVVLRSAMYMSGPLKTLAAVSSPAPTPAPASEPVQAEPAAEPMPEEPPSGPKAGPDSEEPGRAGKPAPAPASSLTAVPDPRGAAKKREVPASAGRSAPRKTPATPRRRQGPAAVPALQASALPAEASPVPPVPAEDVPAVVRDHEIEITLGDRRYRVRGMARNTSLEQLRINLMVAKGEHFHVDNLELYSSRQRGTFLKQASEELQVKQEVLKRDLGNVLMKLEHLQQEQLRKTLEEKEQIVVMSEQEKTEALALLKDPKLLQRVSADLEASGLVGEHTNKLVCFLAALSRKLDKPLGVLIQSSSAAGKSALMDAVLSFMPEEERVQYSAMTGQSLFYMGETNLKQKVLAIAEEEGAERASYPLKLLQSEGELTIASTGKEPSSGRLVTHEYHVEGPTAILLTTTAIDMDEELQNRCVVLAVDESREQTKAIHQRQREDRTLKGLARRLAQSDLRKLHQNAQRLLRPVYVVNSYGESLTFSVNSTRTRRDHMKYLVLIETIALLHQYQREIRNGVFLGRRADYIEVTLDDVAVANELANEALGRTLDELPPQTRRLLHLIDEMVREACQRLKIDRKYFRFTRRQVREYTGWGNTQLKIHLSRLAEMEYVLIHRGGRGQSFVYELVYDGEGRDGKPFVLGLINVEKLRRSGETGEYDAKWSGSEGNRSGQTGKRSAPGRPLVGPRSGGGRGDLNDPDKGDNPDFEGLPPKNAHQGIEKTAGNILTNVPIPSDSSADPEPEEEPSDKPTGSSAEDDER